MHPYIVIVCTEGQMVYLRDKTDRTPSLANLPLQMTPTGTNFSRPVTNSINNEKDIVRKQVCKNYDRRQPNRCILYLKV